MLQGAHVIITGGSQGIGAAFAKEAHDAGARFSLVARHLEGLTQAAAAIGPGVLWRAADVTEPESLNAALAALTAESGPCDILLCCAGAALPGRFLDVPAQEFQEQWRLNVGGSWSPDTQMPGFAAENLRKPSETVAISGAVQAMPAQRVAACLVRGIERNSRNITVDAVTRILLLLGGLAEPILHWSFSRTVTKARR